MKKLLFLSLVTMLSICTMSNAKQVCCGAVGEEGTYSQFTTN